MAHRRMNNLRKRLFEIQGGKCFWCAGPMSFHRDKNGNPKPDFCSFEHLQRLADGGRLSAVDNLVLAHVDCNNKRERGEHIFVCEAA